MTYVYSDISIIDGHAAYAAIIWTPGQVPLDLYGECESEISTACEIEALVNALIDCPDDDVTLYTDMTDLTEIMHGRRHWGMKIDSQIKELLDAVYTHGRDVIVVEVDRKNGKYKSCHQRARALAKGFAKGERQEKVKAEISRRKINGGKWPRRQYMFGDPNQKAVYPIRMNVKPMNFAEMAEVINKLDSSPPDDLALGFNPDDAPLF